MADMNDEPRICDLSVQLPVAVTRDAATQNKEVVMEFSMLMTKAEVMKFFGGVHVQHVAVSEDQKVRVHVRVNTTVEKFEKMCSHMRINPGSEIVNWDADAIKKV